MKRASEAVRLPVSPSTEAPHMRVPESGPVRRLLPAWLWFGALGLVVAGPLLGSGYLLLLDFPSGPNLPRVPVLPLPSSGDLGNALPLLAVHALLREVHSLLPDKLFLLAPILLGGVGVYRFARARLEVGPLAALFGATLFVINPFVRDRYLAGHLHFLLAYSLLPWGLAPIHEALGGAVKASAPRIALWLALLGAIDVHVAGLYAIVIVIALLIVPARRLLFAAVAFGLAIALSAYWLLPAVFATPGADIGPADLTVYASRPRSPEVLASLLSMHGFWRNEFPSLAERFPVLSLLLVPILGLVAAGAFRLLARKDGGRRFGVVVAGAAALALLLAAGTSFPPTAGAFRWAFEHVPFFGVYREPQKFLALVVLAFAVLGAAGLHDVLPDRAGSARWSRGAAAMAVVAVLAYGGGMFWGFGGEVRLSQYPEGWAQAERLMAGGGSGRIIVFPWHLYAVLSFSDGRIVANPAASFFSREVLDAGEAGFPEVPAQSPDPFRRYVTAALEHRKEMSSFGHLMAPLGVRYVALLHEWDWRTYRFLDLQDDLVPMYRDERISLYQNRAWRHRAMPLQAGDALASPGDLFGSEDERDATKELRVAPPLTSRQDDAFPPLARILPGWRTIEPAEEAAFVATRDRCTDGWRLGDETAVCQLGAIAAFKNPMEPKTLWRPLAGARLVGFTLTAVTLAVTALYVRRVSRSTASRRR